MVIKKLIGLWLILCITLTSYAKDNTPSNTEKEKEQIQEKLNSKIFSDLGTFEINDGQFSADFIYSFGSPTASVEFYHDRVVFNLRKQTRKMDFKQMDDFGDFEYLSWSIGLNSNSQMTISHLGEQRINGVNYFTNQNTTAIKKRTATKLIYQNIYENIDLIFYKDVNGSLKYDFILHAGAKVSDIKLDYSGVDNMLVMNDGSLSYSTEWGIIQEDKPFSYLSDDNSTVHISYAVHGSRLQFSSSQDLITTTTVIDPIYVDWSTYFYGNGNGGFAWTWVMDLDIDDSDYVYVTGTTNDKFPTNSNAYDTTVGNGYYDAYICKLAPNGDSIIWFSYIGGAGYEFSTSLTVNQLHQPVIGGFNYYGNFPTTPGAFMETAGSSYWWNCFITKFSDQGDSLIFSTYLGGTDLQRVNSLTIDGAGNVYVAGRTKSNDFPITSGCFQSTYGGSGNGNSYYDQGDGFLTKLNPSGTGLIYSTYVGGAQGDEIIQVALSPANEVYLVGKTSSGNFPITAGSNIFNYNIRGNTDGFVMKFKTDGKTLVYSKLMGGDADDWFEGVYVNANDEAYVAGVSASSNFYTTSKAYSRNLKGGWDIVLVKMNKLGQNVAYSTYIGGSGDEYIQQWWLNKTTNVSIAVNVREEPVLCGMSRSTDFPVTSDALMTTNPSSVVGGYWNTSAVIVKLDYLGEKLLYGTYFGGSSYEYPGANKLKRISCYTNILYGGFTASDDYPTTTGAFKENKSNSSTGYFWTGFISKFRDTLYTDIIDLALTDTIYECDNVFEILDIKNQGADILWSNGSTKRFEIIRDTGTYWVRATYGCDTVRDTITFIKEYSPIIPVLPSDSIYCDLFPTINLDAKNDSMLAIYTWSTADSTQTTSISAPGKYWVRIQTPHCGTKTDTVKYRLLLTPDVQLISDSIFCDSISLTLTGGLTNNDELYSWSTLDSTNSIHISSTGTYQLKAENVCGVDSSEVVIGLLYTPVASLPADSVFCDQTIYTVYANGRDNNQEIYNWWDIDNNVSLGQADSLRIVNTGEFALISSNKCGISSDSISIDLLYSPFVYLGVDSIYCDTLNTTLRSITAITTGSYLWNDGTSNSSKNVNTPGTYWLEVKNKCATSRDSIVFTQKRSPIAIIKNATIGVVNDSLFCDQVNITLESSISDPEATYNWSTGATQSQINVTNAGTYIVTINNHCGIAKDTVNFSLIETPSIELGAEKVFCGAVAPFKVKVGKDLNNETYLWSSGATQNEIDITSGGKYWARISNSCATVSDTLNVRIAKYPIVDLGPDTVLCGNFNVLLDAKNPGMRYMWEPYGETTQTINANEQRMYKVSVTSTDNCTSSDNFEVKGDCISHYYIPSAFSPNNDGINDDFKPSLINYEQYQMQIFNRWGELLFESNNPEDGWDGTYKGVDVQDGVYLYVITVVTTEDLKRRNLSGVINLLR